MQEARSSEESRRKTLSEELEAERDRQSRESIAKLSTDQRAEAAADRDEYNRILAGLRGESIENQRQNWESQATAREAKTALEQAKLTAYQENIQSLMDNRGADTQIKWRALAERIQRDLDLNQQHVDTLLNQMKIAQISSATQVRGQDLTAETARRGQDQATARASMVRQSIEGLAQKARDAKQKDAGTKMLQAFKGLQENPLFNDMEPEEQMKTVLSVAQQFMDNQIPEITIDPGSGMLFWRTAPTATVTPATQKPPAAPSGVAQAPAASGGVTPAAVAAANVQQAPNQAVPTRVMSIKETEEWQRVKGIRTYSEAVAKLKALGFTIK
jgi:hypothetical protein